MPLPTLPKDAIPSFVVTDGDFRPLLSQKGLGSPSLSLGRLTREVKAQLKDLPERMATVVPLRRSKDELPLLVYRKEPSLYIFCAPRALTFLPTPSPHACHLLAGALENYLDGGLPTLPSGFGFVSSLLFPENEPLPKDTFSSLADLCLTLLFRDRIFVEEGPLSPLPLSPKDALEALGKAVAALHRDYPEERKLSFTEEEGERFLTTKEERFPLIAAEVPSGVAVLSPFTFDEQLYDTALTLAVLSSFYLT